MAKNVKLAILRARHDTSRPTIGDQACIQMLMTSPSRRSVLNYWTDNTDGYLDFVDSVLFPWVDVTIAATDTRRATQIAKAYEATKALNNNNDLTGFDGFVVITWPGQMTVPNPMAGQPNQPATVTIGFDAGAGPMVLGKRACALPVMGSDHTFMCHEVGHVLGYGHTYGVWNNGIDWDGIPPWDQGQVYGDPYDIMSSATFGTRVDPNMSRYTGRPQFAGPAVPGWPVPGAVNMGPAPARAHVHQWDAAAVPSQSVRHLQTPSGGTRTVQLYAAGRRNRVPRLVVIHPPNEDSAGRGRCYLEYRDTSGWDAGLDVAGTDLARQAVVAHTLAEATSDGVRCWYRGRILVPVEIDSDLKVTGTPLTVRVVDEDVNEGYVVIEISTSSARGVELTRTRRHDVIHSIDTRDMSTPCGDPIVWGTWITQSQYFFRPYTYGFGGEGAPDVVSPLISWMVGGVPVPAGSGALNVPVSGSVFTVEYALDPVSLELSLSSRGGEQYSVAVIATATEPGGGNAASATATFDPLGYYSGFRPEDRAALDACMIRFLLSIRLRPQDLLIPPGPDPYPEPWSDRINAFRLREVARRIAPRHPAEALGLRVMADMRYGSAAEAATVSGVSRFGRSIINAAVLSATVVAVSMVVTALFRRR